MKSKHLLLTLLLALFVPWAAQAQQLNENFDGNSFPPTDWTTIHVSGSQAWTQGSGTGNSGSKFAYRKDVSGGYEDYLITPLLEPKSGEELSFYLASQYSYNYAGTTLTIEVSTTTPTVAAFTTVLATYTSGSNGTFETTSETDWVNKTVGLSAYVGQQIYIAFHAKDTGYDADVRIDDVTGVTKYIPPCPKPENLLATTDGATATLTWDGTAANGFTIDINGSQVTGQTSPYVFDVALSTTYNVTVTADCDAAGTSDPVSTSFTTPDCIGGHTINYTLNDSYGDGWNGNAILIKDACNLIGTLTLSNGSSNSGSLVLCDGDYYQLTWQAGDYPSETSFTLTVDGTTVYSNQSGFGLTDGQVLYTIGTAPDMLPKPTNLEAGTPDITSVELSWTENGTATAWELCINGDEEHPIAIPSTAVTINEGTVTYTLENLTPDTDYAVKVRSTDGTDVSCWSDEETFTTDEACNKPTDLTETNITTNSATLSWTGEANSYMLQYRPWQQVDEDQVATAVLTPYTFDLSGFKGTGSVAIRHYDVSDMFQLNVDDIVVTNAEGETVYSQNFESGSIPSNITNMDLDGDGNVWGIRANGEDNFGNPYCNGNYCASSASWASVALFPDNWMIISGIELGGQITFIARGQDPEWAAENFAVYVSAEADLVEVADITATSYQANNLTPNTPYAWEVKSDCGNYQSNFASSLFKTKDDMLFFAYDGDWDDIDNWEDAEGNAIGALPTLNNNVSIVAAAEIPAGVVAEANKVTVSGNGAITIKDGGQLKQSSATVKVTVEKEITGYGEGNANFYLIASPFSGRTLYDETSTWNHIEDMFPEETGEERKYDLYAFDATQVGQEWINYRANPTHISFQSSNGNAGLMSGEGYLYANQDGTIIKFVGSTGKSYNYSETIDYTFDGESNDVWNGWALVGNFFSCNAYINYVDADNNVLAADFYVMNAAGDDYTLSQSSVGLPPCTGAFINYSATGKVQYATEAPAGDRAGMLNMTLSQNRGSVDQARVRFGRGYNLKHMSFRNNSSKLYMPVEGNDYAVVYNEEGNGEMPVNFKAENNGTYTLSFSNTDVEFSYLHLIDNMTGNDVDLLATPSYSFEAKTTDYASRFKLVFATGNNTEDNFAFMSNGNLIVSNEGEATLQVIDVNGRILRNESINGSTSVSMNNTPGVYMLRLINGNDVKVQKIVVK